MEFGEFLRFTRLKTDISLRQLALRIGVSATYMSKIERGEFPPPSCRVIIALGRELNFNGELVSMKYGKIPDNIMFIIQQHTADVLHAIQDIVEKNTE